MSTSAIAKYLLSCETLISTTLELTKFVLKISVPVLSNTSITDLYVVLDIRTDTNPFLLTLISVIFPSILFSYKISLSEIK